MHQRKVEKMIKNAEGSAGLLHKNHKDNDVVMSTDLGERRCEVVGPLSRRRKEWSKQWQCDEEVRSMQDKL